jgi:hypothetical protein
LSCPATGTKINLSHCIYHLGLGGAEMETPNRKRRKKKKKKGKS